MISMLCALSISACNPNDALLSVAERTEYARTATYDETVELLDALDKSSEFAARSTMGHTVEGRAIPLLIVSDPPVTNETQARELSANKRRPIVFAIGNIHGGEVDGKEALPMLVRDILHGESRDLLDDVILIIAPIYNADGNERFGDGHRPGQNGPANTGIRENANGRDLNRDFMKLEEPETRALVRSFSDFGAHVFIDCHITNGSYHRYVITYDGPRSPSGDPRINRFARELMLPDIDRHFEQATGNLAFWYGSFEGEFGEADRGHTRWESYPAEPRFGTTYFGLRNRLSVLVESYTYAPYRERVLATRDFVRECLRWIALNSDTLLSTIEAADANPSGWTDAENPIDCFATRSRATATSQPAIIAGFEEQSENGRSHSTGVHKDYAVQLMTEFVAEETVSRARGYLIPPDPMFQEILDTLRLHGIAISKTSEDRRFTTERYTVSTAKSASRVFQGHTLVRCETTSIVEDRVIPAGWWLIDLTQPLSNLAQALLEPTAEDSLATWNRFDPWMKPGAEYPVLRVLR